MPLQHAALFVDDLEATLRFYREVLDLHPTTVDASGKYAELAGLAFLQHDLAEVTIPVGYLAASPGAKTLGVMLSFAVADLESTYEKVLIHGGQKITAPENNTAYVRDVNGILLELVLAAAS